MKIGVVGLGVVGGAAYEGFKLLEHQMFKPDTSWIVSRIWSCKRERK